MMKVIAIANQKGFQYPRADRGECNRVNPSLVNSRAISTFSILVQIVGSATRDALGDDVELVILSVSSCRSWGVQLPVFVECVLAIKDNFQYPRADRGECNVFSVGAVFKS